MEALQTLPRVSLDCVSPAFTNGDAKVPQDSATMSCLPLSLGAHGRVPWRSAVHPEGESWVRIACPGVPKAALGACRDWCSARRGQQAAVRYRITACAATEGCMQGKRGRPSLPSQPDQCPPRRHRAAQAPRRWRSSGMPYHLA